MGVRWIVRVAVGGGYWIGCWRCGGRGVGEKGGVKEAGLEGRGGDGRAYAPSNQVKTWEKPQERTKDSESARGASGVEIGAMS